MFPGHSELLSSFLILRDCCRQHFEQLGVLEPPRRNDRMRWRLDHLRRQQPELLGRNRKSLAISSGGVACFRSFDYAPFRPNPCDFCCQPSVPSVWYTCHTRVCACHRVRAAPRSRVNSLEYLEATKRYKLPRARSARTPTRAGESFGGVPSMTWLITRGEL